MLPCCFTSLLLTGPHFVKTEADFSVQKLPSKWFELFVRACSPWSRRITNRYRRTNPAMDVSKFAAHVLLVLRTKAVGGSCHLATTSDTLKFHF
jgi:hypothetical protein